MSKRSEAELLMEHHLREVFGDSPMIGAEVKFHPTRKWRFDWAIPELKLAVECDGGVFTRGRHTRGSGFIEDCRKYSEATILGWTVFRFPTQMVLNGEAKQYLEAWYAARKRITPILEGA